MAYKKAPSVKIVDKKAVNKFYDILMEKLKQLSLTYLHKEYEK